MMPGFPTRQSSPSEVQPGPQRACERGHTMRRELSRIRTLLRARELDHVHQALEVLRAHDDPAAWREMLEGVHYSPRFADGHDDATLAGPYRGPNAVYAITSVLAHVQPGWVGQVTRLDLRPKRGAMPVSVLGLTQLPALEQLHIHGAGPFSDMEGRFSVLHTVTVTRPVGLEHLRWLTRAPKLRHLELHHAPGLDLRVPLTVEELVLEDWSIRDLTPLVAMRSLRRLELHCPAVRSLEPLADLRLEELRLGRGAPATHGLSGVRIVRT